MYRFPSASGVINDCYPPTTNHRWVFYLDVSALRRQPKIFWKELACLLEVWAFATWKDSSPLTSHVLSCLYHSILDIRTLIDCSVSSMTDSASTALPPKIAKASLAPNLQTLVDSAKGLYQKHLSSFVQDHKPPAYVVAAPGRVNLIGEHVDYTGGFVLPLAIDFSTVIYGTGFCHTGKGNGPTSMRLRLISEKALNGSIVEERRLNGTSRPPDADEPRSWVNYVVGVVQQYMHDLPKEGCTIDLSMAIASDVPLSSGLSSSASLEVAVATFFECFLPENMAYSSAKEKDIRKERALRCQKAENDWTHSPCGIMDQLASSAAQVGKLMLIDCQSLEIEHVTMKANTPEDPVILITNSKVTHSIADSEYGVRRAQCHDALLAMQSIPLYHVLSLRDATKDDVKQAEAKMNKVSYHRALHVVNENVRTKECKVALKMGLWDHVGELMNASHASLRDEYEVSCEEVDYLVEVAQAYEGVYGSRMTGGGFGGCTVTFVQRRVVEGLIKHLQSSYEAKYGKQAECFLTEPAEGARVLAIDMDCKAESAFLK